jgi:hypothetical protein
MNPQDKVAATMGVALILMGLVLMGLGGRKGND